MNKSSIKMPKFKDRYRLHFSPVNLKIAGGIAL